ncbi:MAG: cobalamin biosynthesis protein [Candidatus Hodgkinia cicadicola]
MLAVAFEWVVASKLRWRVFMHPVSAFAHIIGLLLETKYRYNNLYGLVSDCALLAAGALIGFKLQHMLSFNLLGQVFEVLIVSSLFAHGSLVAHVSEIVDRIYNIELDISRAKLAMIVGRNVDCANEHEICAITILSLVENLCDATFSPLLYYLVFRLPGLVVYKIVELADSIYGNYQPENCILGAWIAKLDDVLNYIPSRILSALFFVMLCLNNSISAARRTCSFRAWLGKCEVLIASYLNVKLGGNKRYDNVLVAGKQINASGKLANGLDVKRAQHVTNLVCLVTLLITALFLLTVT